MDQSFLGAVTGLPIPIPQKLVFTSDWQDTLNLDEPYYALLEFLNDAKKAGHRVIITSSMRMDEVKSTLRVFQRSARRRGYDGIDIDQFEFISKPDLKNLKSDYSFDDEPIGAQKYKNYVDATHEIIVWKDYNTSPFSLAQLRNRCGLPARSKAGADLSAPVATPALC